MYNIDTDSCREVTLTPNGAWGGEGRYVPNSIERLVFSGELCVYNVPLNLFTFLWNIAAFFSWQMSSVVYIRVIFCLACYCRMLK